MKKAQLFFSVFQLPLDAFMIGLALSNAYLLRSAGRTDLFQWPYYDYLKMVILTLPIWIIIFSTQGLYKIKQPLRGIKEVSAIFIAVLASWALFIVGLYFIRSAQTQVLPRLILLYSFILTFSYVSIARLLLHWLQRFLYKFGIGVKKVIIIYNSNSISGYLINGIEKNYKLGYKIIHKITQDKIQNIPLIYKKESFDEIISADSDLPKKDMLSLLEFCEGRNITFRQIPNTFEVQTSNIKTSTLLGLPMIEFNHTPLQGWGRVVKRIVDVILSLIAIIILSPVLLILALLVKLDSRGPIIYRNKCVGIDGEEFDLFKFRSMRIECCRGKNYGGDKAEEYFTNLLKNPEAGAEWKKDFKLKDDPRVTRVGKFIRKLSVDELPQLFNILLGNMSIVGPRPIVKDELQKYGKQQFKRHIIKPGMTGLWQVGGRNDIAYSERVKLDMFYIENWSIWIDFSVIIKTILAIFKKSGY